MYGQQISNVTGATRRGSRLLARSIESIATYGSREEVKTLRKESVLSKGDENKYGVGRSVRGARASAVM
jgi:hypothetical protein